MGDVVMDMINGFGYLLIPGFLTLFLLVLCYGKSAGLEEAKADRFRVSGGSRLLEKAAAVQPAKIRN